MNRVIERLKNDLKSEEARYAYADSVTNAFLTAQIKALREERELTQEKLAELVGTKQSGISRWQNTGYSSCKVETLRKFAKALGVRLRITFEEFGSLPADVAGFTKERLAPRKFEEDPAFEEPPVAEPELVEAFTGAGTETGKLKTPTTRTLPDLSWLGNSQDVANTIATGFRGIDEAYAVRRVMELTQLSESGVGLSLAGVSGEEFAAVVARLGTGSSVAELTRKAMGKSENTGTEGRYLSSGTIPTAPTAALQSNDVTGAPSRVIIMPRSRHSRTRIARKYGRPSRATQAKRRA